ncbi:hypothetical protein Tco_1342972 [Tanacetum coccineum]
MKIKRLRREETPRIVGDDSARSEPMKLQDRNDFQTTLEGEEIEGTNSTEFGTEFVQGGRLDFGAQSRRKREVKNARNVACERG